MPSQADIVKDYVTELSRLQDWMIPIKDKVPEVYESMYKRYVELKVVLSSMGVNLTELDRIKEQEELFAPDNEKEYDGYLFDQLTILERLERIAKKTNDKEVMEEISVIRKEVERKLYRPGSKMGQEAVHRS